MRWTTRQPQDSVLECWRPSADGTNFAPSISGIDRLIADTVALGKRLADSIHRHRGLRRARKGNEIANVSLDFSGNQATFAQSRLSQAPATTEPQIPTLKPTEFFLEETYATVFVSCDDRRSVGTDHNYPSRRHRSGAERDICSAAFDRLYGSRCWQVHSINHYVQYQYGWHAVWVRSIFRLPLRT